MNHRAYAVILLILMAPLNACVGPSYPIESGYFATKDVVIAAEDGSFSLKGGSEFAPPFQVDFFNWSDHSCEEFANARDDVRNAYGTALAMGAKRVRVIVPGLTKPLHGILLLNMTKQECLGPAAKTYRIEIPRQYIDAALQGRVSVVYEQMLCDFSRKNFGKRCFTFKYFWYSWILWLSDRQVF